MLTPEASKAGGDAPLRKPGDPLLSGLLSQVSVEPIDRQVRVAHR
jgi:hypothetical protein